MKSSLQSTPFDNVFYYTWLVDFSFLDGNGKDTYNPSADYVTNQKANDEKFLQKDVFVFWGTYSTKDMQTLLDLYVYKQCCVRGFDRKGEYFAEWLNHTISISKTKVLELAKWCETFCVDSGLQTFNPPKFISITMIDDNGTELTQQVKIDDHFGLSNVVLPNEKTNMKDLIPKKNESVQGKSNFERNSDQYNLKEVNIKKVKELYEFCISTAVFLPSFSEAQFMVFVEKADFAELYSQKSTRKMKIKLIIKKINTQLGNKFWYLDAAHSIGAEPTDCSKANPNAIDWQSLLDKF